MATIRGPKIVTNGLILALDAADRKSYPGSDTVWNDLSGNNNHGTLINGPTFNSANGGNIVFDGTNDYVNIPNNSIFSVQNFTISAWVKFSAFGTYNQIFVKPQNGPPWVNPYLSWMLRITNNNLFEFSIGSSTTYYGSNYTYTFSTGTFYNLIGKYDGTNLISYINNSSVKTTAVSATINYSTDPVFIGAGYGSSPVGEFLNGNVYLINMYNRALSDSEILQNFNAQRGRFGI